MKAWRSDTQKARGTSREHLRGEPVSMGADSIANEALPTSDRDVDSKGSVDKIRFHAYLHTT